MSRAADRMQPDHRKLSRATDRRLNNLSPSLPEPVSTADQTYNKVALTLNRAGTSSKSPILAGLGVQAQAFLASGERLEGLYCFVDPDNQGANLKDVASPLADNVWAVNLVPGESYAEAGNKDTGAKRNQFRVHTSRGASDREFWAKSYEADVIAANSHAVLDPDTLDPVAVECSIIDPTRDWLQVAVSFMDSWLDEFGTKCFGGAAYVSFFDTVPGIEGAGGAVDPVTQQPIAGVTTINVQNSIGQKRITARFRSRIDSVHYVDVAFVLTLVWVAGASCSPPLIEPCADVYLPHDSILPHNTPLTPSAEGSPTEPGTAGTTIVTPLLIIAVRGSTVGASATMIVKRWMVVESTTDLSGTQIIEGAESEYIPWSALASNTPAPPVGYQPAKIYVVALSVTEERANQTAFYSVQLKDGEMLSKAVVIAGPDLKRVAFFAGLEQGGGPGCCGPDGCAGSDEPPPSTE